MNQESLYARRCSDKSEGRGGTFSECAMPETARLERTLGQIELGFVEREATPCLLMKLSIQLHLAGLSLSNTVSFLEVFGVDRVRSTVHS